jgi:hypothetical protein
MRICSLSIRRIFIVAITVLGIRAEAAAHSIKCADLFKKIAAAEPVVKSADTAVAVSAGLRQGVSVVTVAVAGEDGQSRYVVNFGTGEPLRTNDVAEIVRAISTQEVAQGIPFYTDLTALSTTRREAFRHSAEIVEARNAGTLKYVADAEPLFREFREGDPVRTATAAEVGTFSSGPFQGKHYARADIGIAGMRWSMTVITRVATAARKFVSRLKAAFATPGNRTESTIAVVVRIRKDIAREYGLTEDEIVVQFQNNLGATQFVERTHPVFSDTVPSPVPRQVAWYAR